MQSLGLTALAATAACVFLLAAAHADAGILDEDAAIAYSTGHDPYDTDGSGNTAVVVGTTSVGPTTVAGFERPDTGASLSGTATFSGEITSSGMRGILATDRARFDELSFGLRDTYTLHGPAGGEVDLTVHFNVDGVVRSIPPARESLEPYSSTGLTEAAITEGLKIAADGAPERGEYLDQDIHHYRNVVREDNPPDEPFDINLSHTMSVSVDDPFTLGYFVRIHHTSRATETDMLNTGIASFDLPDGYSLTSTNGFGTTSAPIPEPGTATVGLVAFGTLAMTRRRRPHPPTPFARNTCDGHRP